MSDLLELATSDDRREAKLFDAAKLSALGEQMTSELARLQDEHPRARIFVALMHRATVGRAARVTRRDYAPTPTPMGHTTPVPPIPQYPSGFFSRYCWW